MSVLITAQALHQSGPLVKLHDGSPVGFIEIAVTVVNSGGDKYAMDGSTQGTVTIEQGKNYYFNVSDSSVATHPLQFSTTSDGTHGGGTAYTTGVTTTGAAGSTGAYVLLETDSSTPTTLYYYCSSHSGMGGSVIKNTFSSHAVDASVVSSNGKVGIGTIASGFTISHKLDVNGDIRVRGNNIRDNSGNAALTFDGSANTQIDGNLTVAGSNTVTLNGVTYTFPSSDGSSGQFLSTNSSGALSWATASGGGGSFSVTELSATITLGDIQDADDAATSGSKMWYVEPTSWSVPSGKTLLGIRVELRNTLFSDTGSGASAFYNTSPIGFADPSGSTVQPCFIGTGWNYGSYYSQGSPYLSVGDGPALGWYYQDSSYSSHYIVNDGATTTDYVNCYAAAGIYFASSTQLRVYFNQSAGSTTWKLQTGTTTSSSVIANLTMIYA